MAPTRLMGPILYFAGAQESEWAFYIQVLINAADPAEALTARVAITDGSTAGGADIGRGQAEVLADFSEVGWGYWVGWKVTVPRLPEQRVLSYTVRTGTGFIDIDKVVVPAAGRLPRIAFFSCNAD